MYILCVYMYLCVSSRRRPEEVAGSHGDVVIGSPLQEQLALPKRGAISCSLEKSSKHIRHVLLSLNISTSRTC